MRIKGLHRLLCGSFFEVGGAKGRQGAPVAEGVAKGRQGASVAEGDGRLAVFMD